MEEACTADITAVRLFVVLLSSVTSDKHSPQNNQEFAVNISSHVTTGVALCNRKMRGTLHNSMTIIYIYSFFITHRRLMHVLCRW